MLLHLVGLLFNMNYDARNHELKIHKLHMRRLEQCGEILRKYLIYAFPSELTVNYFCVLINFQHLVIFSKNIYL